MDNGRRGGIVLMVTLVIAAALFVVTGLFLRESVSISSQYAEASSELYATGLSSELETCMARNYAMVGSTVLDEYLADAMQQEREGKPQAEVAKAVAATLTHLADDPLVVPFVVFENTQHVYFVDGTYATTDADGGIRAEWVDRLRAMQESPVAASHASGPFLVTHGEDGRAVVLAGRMLLGAEDLGGVVGVSVASSLLGDVLEQEGGAGRSAACFAPDGTIVFASGDRSGNVFEAYPAVAGFEGQLDPTATEPLRLWVGLDGPMPRGQVLYEIRYDEEFGLYTLTVDSAQGIFDKMRARVSTLVLATIVIMVLLLFMVVGIVRWYSVRLVKAMTTDELTGLANRRSFVEGYASMVEAEQLSDATLVLIDVDKFKLINDTYGHAAGDLALAAVAAEVRSTVGHDGLAGRWGGDEFIGILNVPAAEALERAQAMIGRVSQLALDGGVRVTISVGATPVDARQPLERMVEQADDALYSTKRGGRGYLTQYQEGITPHAGDKAAVQEGVGAAVVARPLTGAAVEAEGAPQQRSLSHDLLEAFVLSLLEAVHHMVPFVAGGGILIAIAFLIDGASVDFAALSEEARANFGSITPIAANLKEVGSAAFNFMLPIFAAFFARRIGGNEAFMAGFAGGYLSSQSGAGFVGAVCASLVSAFVVRLMRDFAKEANLFIRRLAPVLIYPVFSLLIMSLLMTFLITPVAVAFESSLTALLQSLAARGHEWLGAACGAMMATDMGGPINKAAYHFGVASIASGNPDIMASVMVGGMVPPCGIALCMLLFKDRFTDGERNQGVATFVMGLAFITEGAIPFVLTDPLRVIASCMAGSAVAGALSVLLGCTLMAPHGGIFVFPVVEHPLQYVLALAAGAVVCALLLGLLKGWHRPDAPEPTLDADDVDGLVA